MSEKSKEDLRREVVKVSGGWRSDERTALILDHPSVRAAFDAYDEAIRAERPTFDGDEAEVREWLKVMTMRFIGDSDTCRAAQALALLDAKVAALKTVLDREAETTRRYDEKLDEALSKLERAEQALAERDAAIAVAMNYLNLNPPCPGMAREKLKPFLKPAEAVDPLVDQLRGRARFCRDRGEIKTPELLEAAAEALAKQGYEVRKIGESSDAE